MVNLAIAYLLIAVVLTAYGISLYRRTRSVNRAAQALEAQPCAARRSRADRAMRGGTGQRTDRL